MLLSLYQSFQRISKNDEEEKIIDREIIGTFLKMQEGGGGVSKYLGLQFLWELDYFSHFIYH